MDRIITDNAEREVEKVATCMVITPDVLRAAAEWGAHLIVTHEPTYGNDAEDEAGRVSHQYEPRRYRQ